MKHLYPRLWSILYEPIGSKLCFVTATVIIIIEIPYEQQANAAIKSEKIIAWEKHNLQQLKDEAALERYPVN